MRFKYYEDYEKLKKINKMLGKILYKLYNERGFNCRFLMYDLLRFVKRCKFTKIDYDDGRFFKTKFFCINKFLAQGEEEFPLMKNFNEYGYDKENEVYVKMYEFFENDVFPAIVEIYNSLVERGWYAI